MTKKLVETKFLIFSIAESQEPTMNETEMKKNDSISSSKDTKGDVETSAELESFSEKELKSLCLKYSSLVLLVLQNTCLVLIMRYSRSRDVDVPYLSTTMVVIGELMKLIVCLCILFVQEGCNIRCFARNLNENVLRQPLDCFKISIPSFVYMLYNNLFYVAVSNLDAAIYQVSIQLKILTTALFSVLLLSKKLSRMQWFSLVLLFCGVALVHLRPNFSEISRDAQSTFIGMIAVLLCCLMSGFAGVYFEKVLKSTKQSLWIRNIQLGFIGMILGLLTACVKDGAAIRKNGFFQGYDCIVWTIITLNCLGGLIIALVVKYADNILKGFANSAAIVLSSIASVYLFEFEPSLQFILGTLLVMLAIFMYTRCTVQPLSKPQKPVV